MSSSSPPKRGTAAEKQLDPVAILRRDNTLLEMLATGFRRLASALETGAAVEDKKVQEGIEIHRHFLVETHHEMIAMLDQVLGALPGDPLKAAREDCHREHHTAQEASERMRRELAAMRKGEGAARARLRATLLKEAERWTAHARAEEENLFSQLPDSFRKRAQDEIGDAVRRFRAESAAVEERLSSWTSSWGPASD